MIIQERRRRRLLERGVGEGAAVTGGDQGGGEGERAVLPVELPLPLPAEGKLGEGAAVASGEEVSSWDFAKVRALERVDSRKEGGDNVANDEEYMSAESKELLLNKSLDAFEEASIAAHIPKEDFHAKVKEATKVDGHINKETAGRIIDVLGGDSKREDPSDEVAEARALEGMNVREEEGDLVMNGEEGLVEEDADESRAGGDEEQELTEELAEEEEVLLDKFLDALDSAGLTKDECHVKIDEATKADGHIDNEIAERIIDRLRIASSAGAEDTEGRILLSIDDGEEQLAEGKRDESGGGGEDEELDGEEGVLLNEFLDALEAASLTAHLTKEECHDKIDEATKADGHIDEEIAERIIDGLRKGPKQEDSIVGIADVLALEGVDVGEEGSSSVAAGDGEEGLVEEDADESRAGGDEEQDLAEELAEEEEVLLDKFLDALDSAGLTKEECHDKIDEATKADGHIDKEIAERIIRELRLRSSAGAEGEKYGISRAL